MNPENYLYLSVLLFTIGLRESSCDATPSWCSCVSN